MQEQTTRIFTVAIMSASLLLFADGTTAQSPQTIGTSAPLQTDSPGFTGAVASKSVFRIVCKEKGIFGTGFLHKSGNIITAAHVVDGCPTLDIWLPDNTKMVSKVIKVDENIDLALLKPEKHIDAPALAIANTPNLQVGALISLWGFPAGYSGIPPMLSVGYLSGIDGVKTKSGKVVAQFVLNAAVNHGDSGGPVLLVETGEVIGIADNKIAPLSDTTMSALAALENQPSGFVYPAIMPDGTKHNFSEGQVIAMVLEDLRQQVQLVIGHAVAIGDLRAFLTKNGVDP